MNKQFSPGSYQSIIKIVVKGFLLFVLCNLIFTITNPQDFLGRISGYNLVFPGRKRLPYGERPDLAYNLSISNLPAMFSSHEISGLKLNLDEYRIFIAGDSSVWGYLLKPEATLSEQINDLNVNLPDGRKIHAYNLGYPTISATKDWLLINSGFDYQPDLVLWLVTLDSVLLENQFTSPLVQDNFNTVKQIFSDYGISWMDESRVDPVKDIWGRSIIGQRRVLADIFRLQLYGVLWAATGVDQAYPETYGPPKWDLEPDPSYHTFTPNNFQSSDLAFDLLRAAVIHKGSSRFMIVNEPIFISGGENKDIRYNFFYPRWAYDSYRDWLKQFNNQNEIPYLDLWNLIPPSDFTNSAIHMNAEGTRTLAQGILNGILENFWSKEP